MRGQGISETLPAPTGGWNARDPLAAMDPRDAITLENIIPLASGCKTRPGHAAFSGDLSDAIETLVNYDARGKGSTEQLIVGTDDKLYTLSSAGAETQIGSGFSNDRWQTEAFSGRMIFVNGEDAVRDWDGTTLSSTLVYGHSIIENGDFTAELDNWTPDGGEWTHDSNGLADCDGTQGAATQLVQTPTTALTNGQTYVVTFTLSDRSAGNVRVVVGGTNGTNRSSDGTYVQTITAGAGADFAIEGDSSFVGKIDDVSIAKTNETFINCHAHQGRMFYIEDGSQAFHYAAAGSYAGYTSKFDLSTIAGTGSDLLFMASWSRDSGAGMDDLAAFYFANGSIVVYSGDDPSSASSWSLVGTYRSAAPIGRRSWIKVGGDIVALTIDGYIPLSAVLAEGTYTEQSAHSFKIDRAVKEAASAYSGNFGWQAEHFSEANWFIVNVPISSTQSEQHLRNTITGSWCKLTNLNATQWAVYDGNLYFGSPDGYVYKIAGASDNGAFIDFKAVQAYHYYGNPTVQKIVTLAKAFVDFGFPKFIKHSFFVDFQDKELSEISDPPEGAVSEWNVGEWNVAQWDGGGNTRKSARHNVTGKGFALAHVMRWRSKAQTVSWWGTQIIYKMVGMV